MCPRRPAHACVTDNMRDTSMRRSGLGQVGARKPGPVVALVSGECRGGGRPKALVRWCRHWACGAGRRPVGSGFGPFPQESWSSRQRRRLALLDVGFLHVSPASVCRRGSSVASASAFSPLAGAFWPVAGGCWLLAAGCSLLAVHCLLLAATGYWLPAAGCLLPTAGC